MCLLLGPFWGEWDYYVSFCVCVCWVFAVVVIKVKMLLFH